jgi:hypothetical protein
MDLFNPVEWFSWLYGKVFQGHFYIGAAAVMVVSSLIGLALWIRGVDRYKEQHPVRFEVADPGPKPQTVATVNSQIPRSATVQQGITSTKSSAAMPARPSSTDTSPSGRVSGIVLDGNGVPGVVGVESGGALNNNGDCNLKNVKIMGYGNNGTGIDSHGGLVACNTTLTPGEEPTKPASQQSGNVSAVAMNHVVDVRLRPGADLTQDEASKLVTDAIIAFVGEHKRMPTNHEIEVQLGKNAGAIFANVDCGAHGTGIRSRGSSTFEDVTINQTSCDTGIDDAGNGAHFKRVLITISNGSAVAH